MKYILALDEGTTNIKGQLFDQKGTCVSAAERTLKLTFPGENMVECDPMEMWELTVDTLRDVVKKAGVEPSDIEGIGISNQRESILLWDKETGIPVYPYVIWMDKRCNKECAELAAKPENQKLAFEKAMKPLSSYYPAFKIQWVLDHVPGVRERAEKGKILYGGVETWIVWKLTDGRVHSAEASSACRSLLYDMNTGDWDDELLELFEIPRSILPTIQTTKGDYGIASNLFGCDIPIVGILGDCGASAFGQSCFYPGEVKATLGTSGLLSTVTGTDMSRSPKLLTNVGWEIDGKLNYTVEGGFYSCGATVNWMKDAMRLIENPAETEQMVQQLGENDGVYLVPSFHGIGTPYYVDDIHGMLVGVCMNTGKTHIVRAGLEALAYRIKDTLACFEEELGIVTEVLRVDGGVSKNNLLMQYVADICNVKVERMTNSESCSIGAFYIAALRLGWYKNLEELSAMREVDRVFTPNMSEEKRKKVYAGWKRAVNAALYWAANEENN